MRVEHDDPAPEELLNALFDGDGHYSSPASVVYGRAECHVFPLRACRAACSSFATARTAGRASGS